MSKKTSSTKLCGNLFIGLIMSYFSLVYYTFMYKHSLSIPEKSIGHLAHIAISHVLLVLFLASYIQTVISDPGRVPLFWGFFLEEMDHKTRRYCLICHIFKPERSHHCSACNRCVLNMDHHCPWLNNCVGFYNRKFFLLLLFYSVLLQIEFFLFYMPVWANYIIETIENAFEAPTNLHYLTMVVYLMNAAMMGVLGMFFRFHIKLVMSNLTTIEHMDKKREPEQRNDTANYDMGVYYNFIQIFGKSPLLWFLPVFLKSGLPVGDGVVWPQKPSKAQTYEIDMSIRDMNTNKDVSVDGKASMEGTNITPNEPESYVYANKPTSILSVDQSTTSHALYNILKTTPVISNADGVDPANLKMPFLQPPTFGLSRREPSTSNLTQEGSLNFIGASLSTYPSQNFNMQTAASNYYSQGFKKNLGS